MERRDKERKEAEKRNPQNNEPRVTGDPRGLWSQPPTDRGSSYSYTNTYTGINSYPGSKNNSPYSNARNTRSSSNESNNAISSFHSARSSSNNPSSNPYSTSKSSHEDPRYECDTPYDPPGYGPRTYGNRGTTGFLQGVRKGDEQVENKDW